jgi:CheY-like chemotaxis protein
VHGDAARLMQVFSNLITNAAKYTDPGGRIDIAVTLERGTGEPVVISVSDNGTGIPKSMLADIFQMFAQVDQTLDRAHGGLGIGLTLVKTLVELHGGTVEAESPGPGKGSTFTVTLPVLEGTTRDDAATSPEAAELGAGVAGESGLVGSTSSRVLVVDDMRPSARTMQLLLQGICHDVRVANDGMSALQCLDEFEADVVLCDIAMPGMDGYEVARRIRERPCRQPMLVALTGYGREEDRAEAFAAGFDRHLVKPASLDALKSLFVDVATADASPQPS